MDKGYLVTYSEMHVGVERIIGLFSSYDLAVKCIDGQIATNKPEEWLQSALGRREHVGNDFWFSIIDLNVDSIYEQAYWNM